MGDVLKDTSKPSETLLAVPLMVSDAETGTGLLPYGRERRGEAMARLQKQLRILLSSDRGIPPNAHQKQVNRTNDRNREVHD